MTIVESRRRVMEAIVAGVAFLGLFSLWVVLPKKLLKK